MTAGELPYTLVVHAGLSKEEGKPDNPHLHLVFSERVNDGVERAAEQWFRRAAPKGGDPASGGARKSERTKPRAWLEETRQAWAAEMNLAFDRAGVADRVTPESHAAQLARAREAGDAAAEERLLLNPPSKHIGPAAKHRWEDRSSGAPALKPDRYAAYEEASASAREARSAHARDAAEAAEARSQGRGARRGDRGAGGGAAASRRRGGPAPQGGRRTARGRAAPCRGEAGRGEESPPNGSRPPCPGAWSCTSHTWPTSIRSGTWTATTRRRARTSMRPSTPPSRTARVSAGFAACCRTRRPTPGSVGSSADAAERFGTADLDDAVATAEALRKRVSRVRELFAAPGGDAALVAALEDRNRSWSRTGTPTDIERALDVVERRLDRRQAATWEHRVVLEAEQVFPDAPSTAWRRTGEGFGEFTDTGRPARRLTRTLSERARAVAIAAERPEPPASPGLDDAAVRVGAGARSERLLGRLPPVEGGAPSGSFTGRRCPAGGGRRGRGGTGRAERARLGRPVDRRGRDGRPAVGEHHPWPRTPSCPPRRRSAPGRETSAAQRAVLEQINWETAPPVSLSTEDCRLETPLSAVEGMAAADERHGRALGEWSALPRRRRWFTARPARESPRPTSRQEVAVARAELLGVVRAAMAAELERVMPRPPSEPVRTRPAEALRRHDAPSAPSRAPLGSDGGVERPADGTRPVRGPTRDTPSRPAPATSPPRRPPRRGRGYEPSF